MTLLAPGIVALRDDLDLTLAGLTDSLGAVDTLHSDVSLDSVRVHTEDNVPTITFGGNTEVPYNERGALALASALQVPAPFIKRLGSSGGVEAQGRLLNMMLDYSGGGVIRAEYSEDGGLVDLRDPAHVDITPRQIVRVAGSVLGTDQSPVQRLVDNGDVFSFDVHVPFDHDRGVGGDADSLVEMPSELGHYSWNTHTQITEDSKVGDLTAAGLRFHLDRKRNLAPVVQPWMMRLVCTNGMEATTEMTKIDARGMSVEEVLADLEVKAEAAFSAMEAQMAHFYEMREQEITNPERRLRALARERSIPARTLDALLDAAPEALGDATSEFDLVNLVTNMAHHPVVRNEGGRLLLERAGGGAVNDHALRCHSCHTALLR